MSKKIYPMKLIELAFQDIPSGLVGQFDRSTILRAVDLPGQPEYRWNGARWVTSVEAITDLTGVVEIFAEGRPAGGGERFVNITYTTADINEAALELSAAGGGVLRMLPGDYTLRETSAVSCLVIPSDIHLTGFGRGTRLKVGDSVPGDTHAISTANAALYVEMSNFVLNGNRSRLGAYFGEDDGIGGSNAVRPYIHHLWITETGDCAIDFDNVTGAVIERVNVWDCNGNAVHLAGSTGGSQSKVLHNWFSNCGHARNTAGLANAAGVDVIGLNSLIKGNTITDCYRGVFTAVVSGLSRTLVQGNHVLSPAASMNQGISGDANTVADTNVITGASSSGISACGVVSRNTIDGGAQNINCTAAGARVIDNILTGATSQSVMVNSAGITSGRIAGNQMTRNGTKINFNAGTGVVVEQNDFYGTGTAIAGTTLASNIVRVNP